MFIIEINILELGKDLVIKIKGVKMRIITKLTKNNKKLIEKTFKLQFELGHVGYLHRKCPFTRKNEKYLIIID